MFTFYQKRQFIYPNKVIINSPPSPISFIFNFWSSGMLRGYNETLMHKKTWRSTSSPGRFSLALEVCPTSKAREKLPGDEVAWRFTFWENSFCARSPRERYCQSMICSEHTFESGLWTSWENIIQIMCTGRPVSISLLFTAILFLRAFQLVDFFSQRIAKNLKPVSKLLPDTCPLN